ncbi:ABC transporter substrate-binding protein [Streptomyces sp. NPDC058576]|uniref:ABC transporter substrate-binding protein n=1 Tax=Streptomyces sp. NPDC058576 TaxID=3346547 RepID=UPI003658DF87
MTQGFDRRQLLRLGTGAAAGIGSASLLAACGLGGGTSSTSGSGGSGDGRVTGDVRLAWWGSDLRHEATNKALKRFERKYPDLTAKGEFSGFQGYFDKLATQTAGGNAPDTFQVLVEYVPEYASRNALLDLSSYEGKALNLGDVDQTSVDGGRIGDKLVAISFGDNTPAVYYDKAAMGKLGLQVPEPGWTWDDLVTLGGDVKKKSGGDVFGCHDFSGVSYALETWLRQKGKDLYTKDGGLGFTKGDLEEWFGFWADLRKEKILVPADVQALFKGNNADIPMMKGVCVNFVNYGNLLPGLQLATKNELVLTTQPKAKGEKRAGAYIKAANWLSVYSKAKNTDAAVALIDFFVNDLETGKLLGIDRGAPPSAKVREAVKPTLDKEGKKFLAYLETASQDVTPLDVPAAKGAGTVYAELIKAAEEIGFGRASVSEGADRLYAEAERALR